MKTHDLAKTLSTVVQILRNSRNVELEDLVLGNQVRAVSSITDIPVALSALVALSKFDKMQWRAIIKEYNLPLEVKSTESGRDVVGKILRHLEQNPESRLKIQSAVHKDKPDVSLELMNALNYLLK